MTASTDDQPDGMTQVYAMAPSVFHHRGLRGRRTDVDTNANLGVPPPRMRQRDCPFVTLSTNQMDPLGIKMHAQRLACLWQLIDRNAHFVDLPLQTRGRIGTRRVQQHQPLKA